MAGKMADRGITFGSAHYTECMAKNQVPWHLTELYYIAAKGTDQPTILQTCGRLCGIYIDNIPLTIYSNICDDIVKAYHAQEELIERARQMSSIALDSRLMKDIIPSIPIKKDKCAKRRFTASKVSCRLKRVKDDSNAGGWNWEAEGRTLDISWSDEFGDGTRNVSVSKIFTEIKDINTRELSDYDFKDSIEKFKKWSREDTKIARFMQQGVEPDKKYTKKEFSKICQEYNIEQSHLFRHSYTNSKGYGKIFKREDNFVYMYSELVPEFNRYL